MRVFGRSVLALLFVISCATSWVMSAEKKPEFHFTFDLAKASSIQLKPDTHYTDATGYGWDLGTNPVADGKSVTSDKPYYLSVKTDEGNYLVTITLGSDTSDTDITIKTECRQLQLESIKVPKGQTVQKTFTVNIRTPKLPGGGEVRLKSNEGNWLRWDNKLTIELNGPHPNVRAIDIQKADKLPTIFIAGDSTVCDQPTEPWASWGQMLPRFLDSNVVVANHAHSGESLGSFIGEKRYEKLFSQIKPGDYLIIQMGHNDQKDKAPGAGAFTTYKAHLKQFIAEARKHDATPILVTPMHRRRFDKDGKVVETLGDFPEAVRQTAKEEKVTLIDLHDMSKPFYEALGADGSRVAFQDGTHHNNYGAYELAKCIIEGIRTSDLKLRENITKDFKPFNPAKPDDATHFTLPPSANTDMTKPDGN